MPTFTPRRNLPQAIGSDFPSEYRVAIAAIATAVDVAAIRTDIATATAVVPPATPAGNYFIAADGSLVASGSTTAKAVMWWFLDPTNYAPVATTPPRLIVRMSVATNATAPGITFTAQFAAVSFAGGAGVITPTEGSTTGNAAVVAVPSASTGIVGESAPGAFPAVLGAYAPVINLGGASAAGSLVSIMVQLLALNT